MAGGLIVSNLSWRWIFCVVHRLGAGPTAAAAPPGHAAHRPAAAPGAGLAIAAAGTVPFALAGTHTSELLLSGVLVVRGAGLTTAGHSFQATFWWPVAFTALAVLPAAMLPRRAAAREQGRASQAGPGAPGA